MAELKTGNTPKIITFYLPQYHTIPENDKWWGKGFTEWTNVRKAKPLFPGHDQPKIPLDGRHYDLMEDETKLWQASLAQKYGIFGFCYYHYWFKDGKQLLEKPAEQMLRNPEINLPFCFCWANENWSRNWDGGNREVIMAQEYGGKQDWELHFQYLLPFFRDPRYITYEGKPLFLIYKPEQIVDILAMTRYFRKRAVQEGLPGLCLAVQFPNYYADMYYREDVFDFRLGFEPVHARNVARMTAPGTAKKVKLVRTIFGEWPISFYRKLRKKTGHGYPKAEKLMMYSYQEAWETILQTKWEADFLPGGFVDWDNTPRNVCGVHYEGFTVEKFRDYMTQLLRRAREEGKPAVFLNAWNEWAEGAFLEPDKSCGYGKLEAIQAAIEELQ